MEVVVALAIMSILAAVTMPSVIGAIDSAKVSETADRLQALRDGIYNPATGANAFSQKVGANPGRLSELSNPIQSGDAANYPNSCGNQFSNGQRNNWNNNGPFVKYAIEPGVGLGTPMGLVSDVLTRVPNSATAGVINLTMLNADVERVVMLDEMLNSGDGSAAGSVQWSTPVNSETTLTFVVPINNKC
jgi:type II secretory pathway pseudopilin PulG